MIKRSNVVGIPLKEVGKRLQILNNAIEANNMAIDAEAGCKIDFYPIIPGEKDSLVKSATITVYFLEKGENDD